MFDIYYVFYEDMPMCSKKLMHTNQTQFQGPASRAFEILGSGKEILPASYLQRNKAFSGGITFCRESNREKKAEEQAHVERSIGEDRDERVQQSHTDPAPEYFGQDLGVFHVVFDCRSSSQLRVSVTAADQIHCG